MFEIADVKMAAKFQHKEKFDAYLETLDEQV